MTRMINGVMVADQSDLTELRSEIGSLRSYLDSINDRLQGRIDKLQEDLKKTDRQLDKHAGQIKVLDEALRTLDRTFQSAVKDTENAFEAVNSQVSRTNEFLQAGTGSLEETQHNLVRLIEETLQQRQQQAKQHEDLAARMHQVTEQQDRQRESLRTWADGLRQGIHQIEQANQRTLTAMNDAVGAVGSALVEVQGQVQRDQGALREVITELQDQREALTEQEVQSLETAIAAQEQVQASLERVATLMEGLAASGAALRHAQEENNNQARALEAVRGNNEAAALALQGNPRFASEILAAAPPETLAVANQATGCLLAGDVLAAQAALDRLPHDQWDEQIEVLQALCWLQAGQPGKARSRLESVLVASPGHAGLWLVYGKAHLACGEVTESMRAWERCWQIDPTLLEQDLEARILYEEHQRLAG